MIMAVLYNNCKHTIVLEKKGKCMNKKMALMLCGLLLIIISSCRKKSRQQKKIDQATKERIINNS